MKLFHSQYVFVYGFIIIDFQPRVHAFFNARAFGKAGIPPELLQQDSGVTNAEDQPIVLDPKSPLILPLFPLRKRVRFPTDRLTLNLYEERYLQMSEFILLDQNRSFHLPIFGVIYSSDKPQLIAKGSGPIVPMFESGDVGVICVVQDWVDELVPTSSSETPMRRRIRLNAVAVGRFCIERILHDGTGPSAKGDGGEAMAFILADTKVLLDDCSLDVDMDMISAVETELQHTFNNNKNHNDASSLVEFSDEAGDPIIGSEAASNEGLSPTELVDLVCSMVRYGNDPKMDSQRHELLSFLAASSLLNEPKQTFHGKMTSLLKLQSTQMRLDRLCR